MVVALQQLLLGVLVLTAAPTWIQGTVSSSSSRKPMPAAEILHFPAVSVPSDGRSPRSSFLVLPNNATAMFVVSGAALHESRSHDFGLTWSPPAMIYPHWLYPLYNDSVAVKKRMYQAGEPRFTPLPVLDSHAGNLSPHYAAAVLEYPHGIGALTAQWNGTGLEFAGNLSRLVWLGQDGGAIRHAVTTRAGTVVLSVQENGPICPTQQGESCKTQFPSKVSFVHTRDGHTWTPSHTQMRIGLPPFCSDQWCDVHHGTAPCYGAVEPTTAERPDGTLLTLIRSQTGTLWGVITREDGRAPDGRQPEPFPTTLASTDSPAFLLRLRNGALLLLWVNVATTVPLPCQSSTVGVWTPRPLLHAALSYDGKTWRGHREVYRDPLMALTPTKNGDYGVAYSYGTEQADGSILVRSGQNVGRWGFFRFHPTEFLLATTKTANFSSVAAQKGWNDTQDLVGGEYVTTCVFFRHLTPPDPKTEPHCDHGGNGVTLRLLGPTRQQALCLARASTAVQAAAAWNFPSAIEGRLEIEFSIERGKFGGANFSVADSYVPSWDERAHRQSLFDFEVVAQATGGGMLPDGTYVLPEKAMRLEIQWSLPAKQLKWSVAGASGTLGLVKNVHEGAASYLWMRAGGVGAGFCIRTIHFSAIST